MKKFVSVLFILVMVLSSFNVFAKSFETKDEAVESIKEAIENDKEIKEWVEKQYGSETVFIKAIEMGKEKTAISVASTFSDFQENGGDLTLKDEDFKLISIVLLGVILLAILI